jgi:hypothetical protein
MFGRLLLSVCGYVFVRTSNLQRSGTRICGVMHMPRRVALLGAPNDPNFPNVGRCMFILVARLNNVQWK